MNKTLQTLRYLTKSFSTGIVIGLCIILGTVAVTDLVFYLTSRNSGIQAIVPLTVPFEVAAGSLSFLVGMVLFIPDFKVALSNGVSRKVYFLANLPSAVIATAVFSVFNLLVIKIHGVFYPIISVSDLLYPGTGWVWFLFWHFSLYFLLVMLGRFIILAYYRSSTPMKWAISLAPFAALGLLLIADARLDGTLFREINEYRQWSRMFPRAVPILLTYSALLSGLIYLLIRRAPVKD